eukprot:symbB.v1.2.034430.t1/scaffold4440.1/size39630/5
MQCAVDKPWTSIAATALKRPITLRLRLQMPGQKSWCIWRVLLKRFLAERRKLGHEFQKEFKDLLLSLDESFQIFKADKQKRRLQVGQKKVKEPSCLDREAEEEEQEDDEIVEVGIHQKMLGVLRCCKIPHQDSCSYRNSKVNQGPHGGWSEEIQDCSKAISDPTTLVMSTFPLVTRSADPEEKTELALPETQRPCRVHSIKAIELRQKARKLAMMQKYTAAAKLQAKAAKIEEEWHQFHVVKLKEEKDRSQEMLQQQKHRLERRLEEEQRALGNDAMRAQQQLLHQQSCRKDRLVRRQLKIWKSAGGSNLEEAHSLNKIRMSLCESEMPLTGSKGNSSTTRELHFQVQPDNQL